MTKTLTTERLDEIAKLAIRLHQISGCAAMTSSGETVLHHTHVDEILSALHDVTAELLANREAQPVGFDVLADAVKEVTGGIRMEFNPDTYKGHQSVPFMNFTSLSRIVEMFRTAPPAPAVPNGYCIMPLTLTAANGAKGALSGEFKVSRTVRCYECGGEGCDDCADAGEFEEEITVPWDTIKDIYRAAVEACRAAMLAQPVSQGCKLPVNHQNCPFCGRRQPEVGN